MAAHARLTNGFPEDEKCHNLMTWLIYSTKRPLSNKRPLTLLYGKNMAKCHPKCFRALCPHFVIRTSFSGLLNCSTTGAFIRINEPRHDNTNKMSLHPSAQSDQSSLCTQWVAKDKSFLHVDSKG